MTNLIDLTRLPSDVNGNSRHVVHFLSLLTKDESHSSFLTWADLKYELALMRASVVGGRKHHTKSFGGGIKFQEQEGLMESTVAQAFSSFENSKVFNDAHAQIELTVINDASMHGPAIEAMRNAMARKITPKHAFADIFHQCEIAKQRLRKQGVRIATGAVWLGAVLVAMRLEDSIKDGA